MTQHPSSLHSCTILLVSIKALQANRTVPHLRIPQQRCSASVASVVCRDEVTTPHQQSVVGAKQGSVPTDRVACYTRPLWFQVLVATCKSVMPQCRAVSLHRIAAGTVAKRALHTTVMCIMSVSLVSYIIISTALSTRQSLWVSS